MRSRLTPCVSMLEFVGGILLILGLFSRRVALMLACNMFVAYWGKDSLPLILSSPGG